MTDPVTGGMGQASKEMMQELQKQMQQQAQNANPEEGGASFQNLMVQNNGQVQGPTAAQQVTEATKTRESVGATEVIKTAALKPGATTPVDGAVDPTKVEALSTSKGVKKLLAQVVDGQNKLDDIIKLAVSGKTYNQQELLAIQASVHKFSQELELTSKVVEKATSGIKQTMQTQV